MPDKKSIALVITTRETNAQIRRWKPDLLEIRADLCARCSVEGMLKEIKNRRVLKIPILLTVRNQREEGAASVFPDMEKWALLEACLPLVDMVDIELSSSLLKPTVALAHRLKKKAVVSSHHFKQTPSNDELEVLTRKARASGADFIKIAAYANSANDMWQLIDFTRMNSNANLITVSMGTHGKLSRLILPAVGSQFTYACIGLPKAPGQIDIKTLTDHLKFYYP